MNQLVSQQAGGALVFKGSVSEPATVTVGGQPATVTTDNRFEGQADVPEGTGQVQVVATDPSGNVRTSTYEVSQAGTPKTFTYDLNGNMTSDGTRTYEWDAENRLVAVKEGATTVASFTYDNIGTRRSKTVAGVTITYVLEGSSVVEERQGSSVTKHFQGPGIDNVLAMQDGAGVAAYLTRDHLGSIREHVASAGTLMLRRDYDPWGTLSATAAAVGSWAFTGREWDSEIGLHYYRARYYESSLGRFIGEDPNRPADGPHHYRYVQNNPVTFTDPTGLMTWKCTVLVFTVGASPPWAAKSFILGGGFMTASCWSDCDAAGKKLHVNLVGPIFGGSIGRWPIGSTQSEYELRDPYPFAWDMSLRGFFSFASIGGAAGPGASCVAMNLGAASGNNCGIQGGVDVGGDAYSGSAIKVHHHWEEGCCNQE